MQFFGDKEKQRLATRIFVSASFFVLISAGIWIANWGIKGSKTDTVTELGFNKTVKSISILFFLILVLFASFAIVVLRKPREKWVVRTHTIQLYFWAIVFMMLAVVLPTQMNAAADGLYDECQNDTSPIHYVDQLYDSVNEKFCEPESCMCNADLSLWNKTPEEFNVTEIIQGGLSNFTEGKNWKQLIYAVRMIFGMEGAKNVQSCLQAKFILNRGSRIQMLGQATTYVNLGLTALGAIEDDFGCAGMCRKSTYYSFSDASKGLVDEYCQKQITNWLRDAAPYTAGWMWTFGILTLLCAIFMCLLWQKDEHVLIGSSPLLGHKNQNNSVQ